MVVGVIGRMPFELTIGDCTWLLTCRFCIDMSDDMSFSEDWHAIDMAAAAAAAAAADEFAGGMYGLLWWYGFGAAYAEEGA